MTMLEELTRECEPLLAGIGERNHVRVVVHRRVQHGKRWGWSAGEVVGDGVAVAHLPELVRMDSLRVLAGKPAMWLDEAIRLTGGELVGVSPNLRTDVGKDYVATQLGGAASTTVAKFIAVSNNTNAASTANTATNTTTTRICWGTANATDAAPSTSRGEYTALGMQRATATYAHTTNTTLYTQAITFTATSAITSVQACGMFDNATQNNGTLFLENTYTPTTLANGDALTITWTVNI